MGEIKEVVEKGEPLGAGEEAVSGGDTGETGGVESPSSSEGTSGTAFGPRGALPPSAQPSAADYGVACLAEGKDGGPPLRAQGPGALGPPGRGWYLRPGRPLDQGPRVLGPGGVGKDGSAQFSFRVQTWTYGRIILVKIHVLS